MIGRKEKGRDPLIAQTVAPTVTQTLAPTIHIGFLSL